MSYPGDCSEVDWLQRAQHTKQIHPTEGYEEKAVLELVNSPMASKVTSKEQTMEDGWRQTAKNNRE